MFLSAVSDEHQCVTVQSCLSVTVVVFPCCLNETLCLHSAPGGEKEQRGRRSEEESGAEE